MSNFITELKKRNNATFWVTTVSQLLIAVQIILAVFGKGDLLDQVIQNKILAGVEAILTVLATFGVFNNPITKVNPAPPVVTPVDPTPAPVEPVVAPVDPTPAPAPVQPTEPAQPVVNPEPPVQGPVVTTESK